MPRRPTQTIFAALTLILAWGIVSAQNSDRAIYPAKPVEPYPSISSGGNYLFNYYLPPASTGSPWWVSWSADNTQLAFAIHGSIWHVPVTGGPATEIKHSNDYLSSPEFSPDGRYLAYTVERDGQTINLRILELATGVDLAVTKDEFVSLDPAWSPDSRSLAFVSTRGGGDFHIYVADLEAGSVQAFRSITAVQDSDGRDPSTARRGRYTSPSWTPDGKQLVFVSNRNAQRGSGGIWIMPAEEQGIKNAKLVRHEESVYRLRPCVSPDGSRIVYSSYLGGQYNNLYLIPIEGGDPYKLTFDTSDNFHPKWSPDGKHIAYLSNRAGVSALRTRDVFTGEDLPTDIKTLKWITEKSHLKVKTVDADSGKIIGSRVYNRSSNGKAHVPTSEYHRIARRLGEHYFHTNGVFELDAPPGQFTLQAHHGFEYYPTQKTLNLVAGKTHSVTVPLKRMADWSSNDWYSGDNHVHLNYAGNLLNTPSNLLRMAAAEDLSVVNALVANKYTRIMDHQHYTGAPHTASTDTRILFFNQEYRPPFLGHLSFLDLTSHLIAPFTTGLDGTAIASLYPSNTDVLRQARKQGALGGYVHPYRGNEDPLLTGLGGARAFPVDLALETLGFHELTSQASWGAYTVWHHALNAGFRVPIVGGEDAITDLHRMYILGQLRTYAKIEGKLHWDNWIEAIRQGRTVVTNGPLIEFSVDGVAPGSEIRLAKPGTVKVKGRVHSIAPLDNIELLLNGKPRVLCKTTCTTDPHGVGTLVNFEQAIDIKQSTWITLQAHTDAAIHPVDDHFLQATSNAIWIMVDDKPIRSAESILYFKRWVEALLAQTQLRAGWRSNQEKQTVVNQLRQALAVYDQRLHEPATPAQRESINRNAHEIVQTTASEYSGVIKYGVWLGGKDGDPLYELNSDVVIPAASSIKTALLIEFFAQNKDRLDRPFKPTKKILHRSNNPAIVHFDGDQQDHIRRELTGLTVRQLGEAMIQKKHVSSNASYNAAANVVISALGGPTEATKKIHRRSTNFRELNIQRYMLADRNADGDNVLTVRALAALHRQLANGDLRRVDAKTLTAVRDVLLIEAGDNDRHYYKGGSLSSDPQVRIEAGWRDRGNGEALIYVVAGVRHKRTGHRKAEFDALDTSVATISRALQKLSPTGPGVGER